MPFQMPDADQWYKPKRPVGPGPGTNIVGPIPSPVAPQPTQSRVYIPGQTPDYNSLIRTDPSYLAWQNSSRLTLEQASAARREALRKLAIQYGGIAPGAQDIYGDIDQGTLELAAKNEYSDKARLKRSYDQSIEAFKRALAARGGLQSGELGYGMDQAQTMQGEREYDLGNAFANAAQGAVNQYAGTESQIRQQEYAAILAAQQSVYSNPAYQPTAGYYQEQQAQQAQQQSSPWTDQAVAGVGFTRDPATGRIIYGGVRRAEEGIW